MSRERNREKYLPGYTDNLLLTLTLYWNYIQWTVLLKHSFIRYNFSPIFPVISRVNGKHEHFLSIREILWITSEPVWSECVSVCFIPLRSFPSHSQREINFQSLLHFGWMKNWADLVLPADWLLSISCHQAQRHMTGSLRAPWLAVKNK